MFEIVIPHPVGKQIKKLPKKIHERVLKQIERLAGNPRPLNCKKLMGEELFRIRVGDYRVIYAIDDAHRHVVIARVGHRREVYR